MNAAIIQKINISSVAQILFGAILIAILAQISIPLEPVPITLQTVAILLIGYKFKPETALYSVIAYIAAGLFGVPVFQNFDFGAGVVAGPSGGYIIGFAAAAYAIAKICEISKSWVYMLLAGVAGQLIIFTFGVTWLSGFVGFEDAITYGVMPFILPGLVKTIALVSLLKLVK